MEKIVISVRRLVEFILQSGDINEGFAGGDRMQEGARIHRFIQARRKKANPLYQSEVSLKNTLDFGGFSWCLQGRADGLLVDDSGITMEELKTTLAPLDGFDADENPAHWGQIFCYGFLYLLANPGEEVHFHLTYIHAETLAERQFARTLSKAELEAFVFALLARYEKWADWSARHSQARTDSLAALPFPFSTYRAGQRQLAAGVYNTIRRGKKLFASAPTGIGKTVSTLYPGLKAMAEGLCGKLFYLTAKEVTRSVAENTMALLREKGALASFVTLTAKTKICFLEKPICKPEACPYAKGHYDRIGDALFDLLTAELSITRAVVESYAQKHRVCPHAFGLDLALWCDVVICDYNYAFDPRAKLRRFFGDDGGDYLFLIDEAHNLPDRAREMFSATLKKSPFAALRPYFKTRSPELYLAFGQIAKGFLQLKKEHAPGREMVLTNPPDWTESLLHFGAACEAYLKTGVDAPEKDQLLELYFGVQHFLAIAETVDDHYRSLVELQGSEVSLTLFCLDPCRCLSLAMKACKSAILFSATLLPLPYYFHLLGGQAGDFSLSLPSPFNPDHLLLCSAGFINTRYHHREASVDVIAQLIGAAVAEHKGNYLVYFPSYTYLASVAAAFSQRFPLVQILVQTAGMSPEEQQHFLARFDGENSETLVGFSVLGGAFSEGIDLIGNRLHGAIIVSVGLPQVSFLQNVIRDYYEEVGFNGFDYAYTFPGINKVLQAAGRVIRTETDKGMVLLIDDRYHTTAYRRLLPRHWANIRELRSMDQLSTLLGQTNGVALFHPEKK